MSDAILSQVLTITGFLILTVGIFLTILSKKYVKKRVLKSKSFSNKEVLSKGNPTLLVHLYAPTSSLLRLRFEEKNKRGVVFKLIRWVRTDYSKPSTFNEIFLYGEKMSKGGTVDFVLDPDPNSRYLLKVESDEKALSEDSLKKAVKIFKKCTEISKKGDKYRIRVGAGIELTKLIDMIQKPLLTGLRGEELKTAILEAAKNSGYEKYFLEWYTKNSAIFDELAEILCSERSTPSTREIQFKYELIGMERPYEWLFHVGLALITSGTVIFIAGLK